MCDVYLRTLVALLIFFVIAMTLEITDGSRYLQAIHSADNGTANKEVSTVFTKSLILVEL